MKISTQELLIVFAIVLLVFGPSQLPKLGRIFGKSMKSFKDSMKDEETDYQESEI